MAYSATCSEWPPEQVTTTCPVFFHDFLCYSNNNNVLFYV